MILINCLLSVHGSNENKDIIIAKNNIFLSYSIYSRVEGSAVKFQS